MNRTFLHHLNRDTFGAFLSYGIQMRFIVADGRKYHERDTII